MDKLAEAPEEKSAEGLVTADLMPGPDEEPRRFSRRWAVDKYYGCGDGPLHPEIWRG